MSAEVEIRRRIGDRGAITFAEFMELALFWPDGGYYMTGDPVGASGDYYTSPQAHPVFGALLAVQLYQMWQLLSRPAPFTVIELGAGSGLLCRDIVACSNHLPTGFARSLRYVCVDRRAARGAEGALGDEAPAAQVCRVAASRIPFRCVLGCILSNELLDSFPVHQVTMSQDGLRETYVSLDGDELRTSLGELSTPKLANRLEALEIDLQKGQTAEISLGLHTWAADAAASLEAGFVLTVDYGHPAAELYSAERRYRGALTTYYRHTQIDAPLRHIGRQDITAQVDFTSVVNAGRRNGLEPLGFAYQAEFLKHLGLTRMQQRLARLDLSQNAAQANRAGILELGRTGGLGDFKVLAQGKGVGHPDLWGFKHSGQAATLVEDIPAPLLTDQHLWLPQGRYPNTELEFEVAWPL